MSVLMAINLMPQDIATLREAYRLRKNEYEALRSAGQWAGAVMHAGILLELALKISVCRNLDVFRLPKIFQIHDLEFLLYCSGLQKAYSQNPTLFGNFSIIATRWSLELRYEGPLVTEQDSDDVHQARFDSPHGVLTFLSPHL